MHVKANRTAAIVVEFFLPAENLATDARELSAKELKHHRKF
jgi:hypothetical protein